MAPGEIDVVMSAKRSGTPNRAAVPKLYLVPEWLGRLYRGPGVSWPTFLAAASPPAKIFEECARVLLPKPCAGAVRRVLSG